MPENEKNGLTVEEQLANQKAEFEKQLADLTAKHNSEMATLRTQAKAEKDKAVESVKKEMSMSAEELAKQKYDEEFNSLKQQNAELLKFKQETKVLSAINENKLPNYFAHDNRLTSANTDEELANAVKEVVADYQKSLPKGTSVNTNVNANSDTNPTTDKDIERWSKMK